MTFGDNGDTPDIQKERSGSGAIRPGRNNDRRDLRVDRSWTSLLVL